MEKKCEFPNCEKEASYKLTYTEKGARKKEKLVCISHRNLEKIHDPINIKDERVK